MFELVTTAQTCFFCEGQVGSPDPLHSHLAYSWAKPDYLGKMCAFCQNSRARVFPLLDKPTAKDKSRASKELTLLTRSFSYT